MLDWDASAIEQEEEEEREWEDNWDDEEAEDDFSSTLRDILAAVDSAKRT